MNCNECAGDTSAVTSVAQIFLCKQHATEKLTELEQEKQTQEQLLKSAKTKYKALCQKYDVDSYGELEHKTTVEEQIDISDTELETVKNAETEVAITQQNLRETTNKINELKQNSSVKLSH